jgi:hypothetical protein
MDRYEIQNIIIVCCVAVCIGYGYFIKRANDGGHKEKVSTLIRSMLYFIVLLVIAAIIMPVIMSAA